MGKATGFMEYKREKVQEQAPLERISSWKEYASKLTDEKLQTQGARCMDCGTPFIWGLKSAVLQRDVQLIMSSPSGMI